MVGNDWMNGWVQMKTNDGKMTMAMAMAMEWYWWLRQKRGGRANDRRAKNPSVEAN